MEKNSTIGMQILENLLFLTQLVGHQQKLQIGQVLLLICESVKTLILEKSLSLLISLEYILSTPGSDDEVVVHDFLNHNND